MVNTGKPSGGCKLCRARRIKCDETKPACLKCLRSKRQCPGYRDPFEGKIRDETQATIRKFKRTRIVIEKEQVLREEGLRIYEVRGAPDGFLACPTTDDDDDGGDDDDDDNNNGGGTRPDRSSDALTNPCFRRRREQSSTPPHSASSSSTGSFSWIHADFITTLATPVEQQATCYLLADYVLVSDSPGGRRGHYKFAYKILTRPERPSRALLSAFKAVSFVALASRPGASHLVIEAESHYSKALREVNKAIHDPKQVKHDDTLAAVLLLAFYETLSSTRDQLHEYISHIKGAAQLVKLRGARQHDTDEGAEMFSMTRNQLLAIRSMAPDLVGGEDYSWLLHQSCQNAYVSRVATLTIACCEIRMKVDHALAAMPGASRDPARVRVVLDLLRAAQAMSRRLSSLDQPQSSVWRVNKNVWSPRGEEEEDEEAWSPEDTYSFHSLYVCMIYTIIWTSHLFLTTCIFRCMAWLVQPDDWRGGGGGGGGGSGGGGGDDEYELAVQATRRRIGDIVASMAYACSWNGYRQEYADFTCGTPGPGSPSKGVAGMCVFRPAFTAMMSDYATPEQKAYLRGRLRFLADEVGIKQVNVLLKLQDKAAHPSKDIERDRLRGLE